MVERSVLRQGELSGTVVLAGLGRAEQELLSHWCANKALRVIVCRDEFEVRAAFAQPDVILGIVDDAMECVAPAELCAALKVQSTQACLLYLGRDTHPETEERAFSAGADAFLGRPFALEQLILRADAVLRRASGVVSRPISCGPIVVDTERGYAAVMGEPLQLSRLELELLAFLIENQGRVVAPLEIAERLFKRRVGPEELSQVRAHVSRLGAKLGPARDRLRQQVGKGYVLVPVLRPV